MKSTEEGFDHVGWANALASQLEDLAATASLDSPNSEDYNSTEIAHLGLDVPHYGSSDPTEQGAHDTEPSRHIDRSLLRLRENPAGAIEALRRHPVLQRALAGSDRNDTIQLIGLYWAARVDLRALVERLVQLTIRTSGQHAVSMLHRLLTLGECNGLKAYEITLFDGLELEHRIDIGERAYLAPFCQVQNHHGPPVSMVVGRPLQIIEEPMGKDERLMNAAALVREVRWGPAITSASAELNGTLVTDFHFCLEEAVVEDEWSTFQFPSNQQTFRDLLSIASGNHVIPAGRYIRLPKWMEGIDFHFKAGWSIGRIRDHVRRRHDSLTEESAQMLLSMIDGWTAYRGDRKSLGIAIRRLADSRSRIGRFGREDCILDTAIALESMYGLSSSEISYRLATRAGHYLGDESNERLRMFELVRRFYDARSAVIHGSSRRKIKVSLKDALDDGFQIARMTVVKLLEDGDAPDWDALVMSAGNDYRVLQDDSRA